MSESAPTASSKAEPLQTPPQSLKPEIIDDKSPHCIPFILSRLEIHLKKQLNKPFFIGLNGVQGAGKTTLVIRFYSDFEFGNRN
jgi:D-glycerate 3-kinase